MASTLTSPPAATKATALSRHRKNGEPERTSSAVSFRLSHKPKFRIWSKSRQNHSTVMRAQLKEVPEDGSITGPNTPIQTEGTALEAKNSKPSVIPSSGVLATEESISEFISQVANLVKLVDSRDIVELQLKQLDCEVVIRKKEALPQPPSPLPPTMTYLPSPPIAAPVPPLPASSAAPAPSPVPRQTSSPAVTSAKSSLPPFKCPMAGTFYRSPGPGEPPFVKVGDKVTKGQVLCIIEAMKLMNEIEADQSGTIIEIVAEDGKPVSVDTPLFIIEP